MKRSKNRANRASETRPCFSMIHIGRKHTGKSTHTARRVREYARAYPNRKVLIIDINGSPAYSEWPWIDYHEFANWKKGVRRFWDRDTSKMLEFLLTRMPGTVHYPCDTGLIVWEDCTAYIGFNPPSEIRQFLVSHRMMDLDMIYTFHSVNQVPRFYWQMTGIITLQKTQEELQLKDLKRKVIPNYAAIYEAWTSVMADTDPYSFRVVNTLI